MRPPAIVVVVLALGASVAAMPAAEQRATRDAELAREPSWAFPGAEDVRRRAVAWAVEAAGPEGAALVEQIW